MTRCLLEDGILRGELCRLIVEILLVEWYRFGDTKGFLIFAR